MTEIAAKVAAILDSNLVAFNAGDRSGVEVGNKVTIWRSMALIDPDSKGPLGDLRMRTLGLEIVHVQDTLSVGQVTDLAESDQVYAVTVTGWQRRKRITQEPTEADINTVLVRIGDEATIAVYLRRGLRRRPGSLS